MIFLHPWPKDEREFRHRVLPYKANVGRYYDKVLAGQWLSIHGGQINGLHMIKYLFGFVVRLLDDWVFNAQFKCGICSRVQMFVIRTRKCRFSSHNLFIFHLFPCFYQVKNRNHHQTLKIQCIATLKEHSLTMIQETYTYLLQNTRKKISLTGWPQKPQYSKHLKHNTTIHMFLILFECIIC